MGEDASILGRSCGLIVWVGGLVAVASGVAGALPASDPLFVPIALGFTLAGVTLMLFERPIARRVLAALVMLAAVALVGPAVAGAEPGEPLPRAIVVLFALGAALALARTPLRVGADALALLVATFAAGALVAATTGVEGGSDDPLRPGSTVEACAWLVLTAGVLLVNGRPRPISVPAWRPAILVGVATATLSGLLFQALSLREEDQLEATLDGTAREIRGEFAAELRARRHSISRLGAEWEGRFLRLRGLWESDVRLILSRSPGLEGIEWIDASGARGWTYPKDMRNAPPELPPAELGRERPRAFAIGPERLADGRLGFRMLEPVSRSDPGQGWLSGVFVADALFASIAERLPEGWVVAVSAGDRSLHRSPSADAEWVSGRATQRTLEVLPGLPLTVSVGASPELLAERTSRLPGTVLLTGLALSLLLTVTLRLWLVARSLARHLETRVEERTALLARSNENLRSFASFLSHEMRQPVNAQTLWADLLETDYAEGLDEQGRRGLSEVRRLARRMGELIEGQLELFALSSANDELGPVDLGTVLEEVSRDLKAELTRHDARIEWDELPVVSGDARQLQQLFRNLVDNSLKYRRPDVRPTIHVSAEIRGELAEVDYRDDGRGFPARDAERIFQIGLRLDDRSHPGHGLGLAMCRAIAERHGGSLTAEGRPGRGATFHIVLPLARARPGEGDD